MIALLARLRCRYRWWRLRRRRRRLLYAYADIAKIRYGLGPGFSPLLHAYSELEREGLASTNEDGEFVWHWPEDGGGPRA